MDNDQLRKAMEDIRAVREMEASDAPVWYGADEASAWANGFNDAAQKVIEYVTVLAANEPLAAPAWEDLTAIIRPMIESVCSDGNSDAARLAKDIADRIIASCSLTRPKEK